MPSRVPSLRMLRSFFTDGVSAGGALGAPGEAAGWWGSASLAVSAWHLGLGVPRLCIRGLTGAMPAPRALSPHSLWVTAGVGGTRRTRGVTAAPVTPRPPLCCVTLQSLDSLGTSEDTRSKRHSTSDLSDVTFSDVRKEGWLHYKQILTKKGKVRGGSPAPRGPHGRLSQQ